MESRSLGNLSKSGAKELKSGPEEILTPPTVETSPTIPIFLRKNIVICDTKLLYLFFRLIIRIKMYKFFYYNQLNRKSRIRDKLVKHIKIIAM